MSQVTYTKILALGLEKRVLLWLGSLACTKGGSSGLLAGSSLGFGRLVIETKSAIAYNNATRSSSAYFHTPSINATKKKATNLESFASPSNWVHLPSTAKTGSSMYIIDE